TNMKLIKLRDAVELTGMSRSWFYGNIENGLIPCLRFGKSIRFDADQLIEWFKSGNFERAKKEVLANHATKSFSKSEKK
ncbi:MAG: helix-turn-helix transcriptional regulator, partial [bacterium]